jgi:arginyl-tRNA synthetase
MYNFVESQLLPYSKAISELLKNEGSLTTSPQINIEKIKDFRFGHLTLNTPMQFAKQLQTSPMILAAKIRSKLEKTDSEQSQKLFDKVETAAPGFVNITLSSNFFIKLAKEILTNPHYGNNEIEKGEIWSIEHTSPNPNKAMHIGHLRNNLVGMSLANLLEKCGASVTKEAIMNDRGIAIAKLMYGYLYGMILPDDLAQIKSKEMNLQEFIKYWVNDGSGWQTPESLDINEDLFVTQCYIKGEEFMTDHETDIRQLVVDWEAGDDNNHKLWKYILDYSYSGMNKTLTRLESSWDKIWYESEHYKEGKSLVEEGLQKGIFQKLEDGAVLTNLESYKIPDTILQKRDGTSLYITQDLALTKKKKLQNKADKLVWVVGPDQSLAMKQVFACCEQLGIGKVEDFWHITYGYVGLADKDGGFVKMSSRKGNVLLIDDVIDVVKEKLLEQMKEKDGARAENLALAAIKFAILKSGKDESLTFDINTSVDVKGDTGIYVMYTLARIHSILEKSGDTPAEVTSDEVFDKLTSSSTILCTLLFYPNAIEKSYRDKSAHHVAQFILELCGAFNTLYEQEKIIDENDTAKIKLVLLKLTEKTLIHALQILNITPVFKV